MKERRSILFGIPVIHERVMSIYVKRIRVVKVTLQKAHMCAGSPESKTIIDESEILNQAVSSRTIVKGFSFNVL